MGLRAILAAKGDEVVSIDSSADLSAAAELLTKRHIGALVVLDAGERLSGILSERDIVRAMAESGSAVLQMPVARVMTRNVSTCDVNDSISSVMDRMTKGKFRHMPVLDKDRLVGMVSIGDVLKRHIETIREHIHQLEVSMAEFDMIRL
jgi:CBS domain-containing protein